jgi:hypothetical protein
MKIQRCKLRQYLLPRCFVFYANLSPNGASTIQSHDFLFHIKILKYNSSAEIGSLPNSRDSNVRM